MPADPPSALEIAERCEALLREVLAMPMLDDEWEAFLDAHPELDALAELGDDDAR